MGVGSSLQGAYRRFHTLSFDVVLGSVGAATFMGYAWGATLQLLHLALLAVATWLVYTLDHLLDAERIAAPATNPRHAYFQRNKRWLWRTWGGLAVLGAALAVYAAYSNRLLLVLGAWAGGLVAVHLLVVAVFSRTGVRWLPKEFTVAFIYSYGVTIPALVAAPVLEPRYAATVFTMLVLLAWMNLLIYSRFECQSDSADGQLSTAASLGVPTADVFISCLVVCNLGLALWLQFQPGGYIEHRAARWLGIASGLEGMVLLFPGFAATADRYRIWAEGVFLLPLLLWL